MIDHYTTGVLIDQTTNPEPDTRDRISFISISELKKALMIFLLSGSIASIMVTVAARGFVCRIGFYCPVPDGSRCIQKIFDL